MTKHKKTLKMSKMRRGRPEVSCEKSVLKNFAIFKGKYLRWCLFLIKLLA